MNGQHTPGPWSVSCGGIWAKSPWNATVRIAEVARFSPTNGIDHAANERLIAAAPALYTALARLVARYEFDGIPNDSEPYVDAARDALALLTPEAAP